ncbi:MAG: UDP-glucose/GDP-mannose dehydrogenase family protein, partial [Acidobacteria bacterium]|nr:UDP-glucose/GDP-mannose dehydrogenase family protein [Acidobacteriota bacterium]
MQIAVIGTGYVGLVTGACFAEFGVDVTCVDVDKAKIDGLNNGEIPIYEPGLDKIVSKNVAAGRLHFTTDITSAVENALVVFLAVGTPPKEDGSPDMSFYQSAAKDIADSMNGYKVLVTKSTVPVGTGKWLREFVAANLKTETNFGVASNPEFLREGAAIEDFMRPDRVVIGSNEEDAIAIMKDLYRPLYLIETPIVITSLEAAELIKYAANAFLATKITFINEIANLCDAIGCDVHDVARGMGMDKRVGSKFLHPGPGYGGSCFPKDVSALVRTAREAKSPVSLIEQVEKANLER